MHKTEQIKEMLCKELDGYADKKLDGGVLEVVDKLAHAIKNLDKIIENEGGYSGRAYERDSRGRFVGDYQNGYSMNRDSYYGGDNSQNGYSMNYSRDMQSIKQELRDIMDRVDGQTRQRLQRIMEKM
jgi:hypothetical protein